MQFSDATDHDTDPISIAIEKQTDMQAVDQESHSLLASSDSPTSQSQDTFSGRDSDCTPANDDSRIVQLEQGHAQPQSAYPIFLSTLKLRINIF